MKTGKCHWWLTQTNIISVFQADPNSVFFESGGVLTHTGRRTRYVLTLKDGIADPPVFDGLVLCIRSTSDRVIFEQRIDDGTSTTDLPNVRLSNDFPTI